MKRWVFRIVLFSLLGAIINVAVAWGCVWFVDLTARGGGMSATYDHYTNWFDQDDGYEGYTATRFRRAGAQQVTVYYSCSFDGIPGQNTCSFKEIIPLWAREFLDIPEMMGRERTFDDDVLTHYAIIDARGWPWLSMWGGVKKPMEGVSIIIDDTPLKLEPKHCCSIELKSTAGNSDVRILPFCPIWCGFAVNTLFYAAIVWLCFVAPFSLRRNWRGKHGRCPNCSYPIGTSNTCTECGRPVKRKIVAQKAGAV